MSSKTLYKLVTTIVQEAISDPEWMQKFVAGASPTAKFFNPNLKRNIAKAQTYKAIAVYNLDGNLLKYTFLDSEDLTLGRATKELGLQTDDLDNDARPKHGYFWRKIPINQEIPEKIDVTKIKKYRQLGIPGNPKHPPKPVTIRILELNPTTKEPYKSYKDIDSVQRSFRQMGIATEKEKIFADISAGIPIHGRLFQFGKV